MRAIKFLFLMLILLIGGMGVLAQETPTAVPTVDPLPTLQTMMTLVNVEAQRVERAIADADNRVENAFNLLGLFEAIGLVVAVAGGIGALVGAIYIRNIRRAGRALRDTRKRVELRILSTEQLLERQAKSSTEILQQTREEMNIQAQASKSLQEQMQGQLQTATDEFRATGELLTREVQTALDTLQKQTGQNQLQLERLRHDVEQNAEQQRKRTINALLGQSLQMLAERQYRASDFEGAIDSLKRAVSADNDNPISHYRLGYVYVQSSFLDEAETHLKRALEIDPNLAQALATLGYVYRRRAQEMPMGAERLDLFNQAERKLLEALQISRRLIDDDGESWWGSLGGLYRRQNRTQEAIHAYEQAAKVTPRSSYPFSNLAMLYLSLGNHAAMRDNFLKVEALAFAETQANTNNYWAFADLVTSRLALGKTEQAETALNALLFATPSGALYGLETLLETLERLLNALGGQAAAPHIPPFIHKIRDHISRMGNNE